MISNSTFLQGAINKSAGAYFRLLLNTSPIHLVGLMYALGLLLYSKTVLGPNENRLKNSVNIIAIISWPLCFLVGLSTLGFLGAGFQSRFLLPMLPLTSILSALPVFYCDNFYSPTRDRESLSFTKIHRNSNGIIVIVLILFGALHTLYYGVLFPTLFADLDYSIFEVIQVILNSPVQSISSKNVLDETFRFMKHYGLNRSVS